MANSKGYGVRGIQRIATYPIQTGATFAQHDFIVKTNTGATAMAAAGAAYDGTNQILGRALHSSAADPASLNGVAPTFVQFIVAEPGTEFEIPLYSATPANAVPTLTNLEGRFALRQSATGFPQLNVDSTTVPAGQLVEPDPKDAPGWEGGSVAGAALFASVWVAIVDDYAAMAPSR